MLKEAKVRSLAAGISFKDKIIRSVKHGVKFHHAGA